MASISQNRKVSVRNMRSGGSRPDYEWNAVLSRVIPNGTTFTRLSSASFVGSDGLIKYQGYNLFKYSEEPANAAWIKSSLAVTAGGDLIPNTNTVPRYFYQDTSITNALPYIDYYEVKANGYNFVQLTGSTGFDFEWVNFNLATGTTAASGLTTGASGINNLGDGWYGIWLRLPATSTALGRMILSPLNANTALRTPSYTGNGVSGITVRKAARYQSTTLPEYSKTTASANSAPRFTYDPSTLQSMGYLSESQTTNLGTYSGDTSSVMWSGTAATKTSTNNTAPDGSATAGLFTSDGTSTSHYVLAGSGVSYVSGTTYTLSCFAKAGTTNLIQLTGNGGIFGTLQWANFQLSGAGTVTSVTGGTAGIEQYPNGWYRIYLTIPAVGTGALNGGVYVFIDSPTATRLPTNTVSTSFQLWGYQVEARSMVTSYIQTEASQVTRAGDISSCALSGMIPNFNSVEGSMFFNVNAKGQDESTRYLFQIDDGTAHNRVAAYINSATNSFGFIIITGAVQQASFLSPIAKTDGNNKIMAVWGANYAQIYVNGVAATPDTSLTIPTGLTTCRFNATTNVSQLNGIYARLAYYNRQLTAQQCIGLTT